MSCSFDATLESFFRFHWMWDARIFKWRITFEILIGFLCLRFAQPCTHMRIKQIFECCFVVNVKYAKLMNFPESVGLQKTECAFDSWENDKQLCACSPHAPNIECKNLISHLKWKLFQAAAGHQIIFKMIYFLPNK